MLESTEQLIQIILSLSPQRREHDFSVKVSILGANSVLEVIFGITLKKYFLGSCKFQYFFLDLLSCKRIHSVLQPLKSKMRLSQYKLDGLLKLNSGEESIGVEGE